MTEDQIALKKQITRLQAALADGVRKRGADTYLDRLRREIADTRLQMQQARQGK